MKNQIMKYIKMSLDEVGASLQELLNELRYYDPIDILKAIKLYHFATSQGHYSETQDRSINIELQNAKRYLTSIYMAKKIPFVADDKKRGCSFQNITTLVKQINSVCMNCKIYLEFCASDENKEHLGGANIYESVEGRTYVCFASSVINMLLSSQSDLLKEIYKIEFEEITQGLEQLMINTISILKEGELKLNDNCFSRVNQFIPNSNVCVDEITRWPESLIKDLSFEEGEADYYFIRDKYQGWYNVEMPVNRKPFIRIGEKSYCFDHNMCFDSFYRCLQKAVQKKDKLFVEKWKKNQTLVSECATGEMLVSVFEGAKKYINVFYRDGKNWFETDGVLIYGNAIIIYEIKGGSYTPDSTYVNQKSHETSQKTLLDAPIGQCKRFITKLIKDRNIDLYDEQHSLIGKINFCNDTIIIPFAVTLDAIGEIACTYNNSKVLNNEFEETIAISFHDLLIYCNFFDSPLIFLHYLHERKKTINKINLMNFDELNYLGYYLFQPHFADYFNGLKGEFDKDIGIVYMGPEYGDIDKYFSSLNPIDKPSFCFNNFIEHIVRLLDKDNNAFKTNIAIELLDLSKESQDNFQNIVLEICRRQIARDRFSSVTFYDINDTQMIPIQLFCNCNEKEYVTRNKAHEYAIATLIANKFEKLYYMVLQINNDSNVKEVNINYVTKNSTILYKNGYFNDLVNHILLTQKKDI